MSSLRLAPVIAALITAAALISPAFAGTLAFDDATANSSAGVSSYAGLTWTNMSVCRDDFFPSLGLQSGFDHGILSPRYAAMNSTEGYAIIQSATPFDFFGGAFTSLGKNNAKLTVEGYLPGDPLGNVSTAGTPTYSSIYQFSAGAPTNVSVNFTGVTAIKIVAFRWDDLGTTTNAYPSPPTLGDFFVLDNFSYSGPSSAPEPASLGILGLGALALLRRRR